MSLEGKVAIVTGAAGDIGSAIAQRIAKEKAIIAAVDINSQGLLNVVNEIKAKGWEAYGIKADVTNSEQIRGMVNQVLDHYGKIDILVNIAGGSTREKAALFHKSTEEAWEFVININLKGTMICCREVINHMLERKRGVIINMASQSGVYGLARFADYSAAKGGIIAFTKALAKEIGSSQVRINSISPGVVGTRALGSLSAEKLESIRNLIPMSRLGRPDDIANLVAFLVSDEASWITGENFLITGGQSG